MLARSLTHGEVTLALHELCAPTGRAVSTSDSDAGIRLLLVHELASSTRGWGTLPAAATARFPGGVYGLDLAGHGESEWRRGGAYTPELFAADVAIALEELGPSVVAGAGLGAYVAVLIAGARPDLVSAALLLPGRGLAGGGAIPDFARGPAPSEDVARLLREAGAGAESGSGAQPPAFDLLVASCLGDIRPVDYACSLAATSNALLLVEPVGCEVLPAWWVAISGESKVVSSRDDLWEALGRLGDRDLSRLIEPSRTRR
jgi:pimeloyl-ACP methyl ester carboxylesterase